MALKSRIVTVQDRNGNKQIVVLDPHSGRVAHKYDVGSKEACDRDVRTIKENLERKGHRAEVIEQTK